jgi:hypothetical protein
VGDFSIGEREAVFRRVGGPGDEPAVFGFLNEVVEIEVAGFLEDRIDAAEVVLVSGEGVVFPQVLAEPCGAADGGTP